ncbi:hypothetical protein Indivirus_4_32 [Indivirus ILV1]|uniref:Uncharacterized protein n=1 Tax=Indivirus ILV1 TaxID=1977633 RepID=A0A1V0SDR0_9VIRU|nr:hypothetical protein Indivirus_4_32 [Indivirus ILV1]
MDYFYERNIVEIKNEYTTFLINIVTPFIYEGIKSVYSFALNAHNEFIERGKYDPNIKSPGILKLFQISLKEIPTLNNHTIEVEANRIKSGSKCADWFDDLVKAVIKCHIVLLTFNNPKKRPELLKEEYHNKIEIKDFLHKCYVESARLIYNNPELYWHEFPSLEIKRNQREACELIKEAIREAIRKMLPIKLILKEYLTNNYYDDLENNMPEDKYLNIHSMLKRDLHGVPGREQVPIKSALVSDDDIFNDQGGGERDEENQIQDYMESSSSSSESRSHVQSSSSSTSSQSSESENQDGGENNDSDDVLESVKHRLEELEAQAAKQNLEQKQEEQDQEPDIIKNEEIDKIKIPETFEVNNANNTVVKNPTLSGGIPKADQDTEIKNLLKNPSIIKTIEKEKKLSKKEQNMLNEIEAQIRPKSQEPNKNAWFEQYMK